MWDWQGDEIVLRRMITRGARCGCQCLQIFEYHPHLFSPKRIHHRNPQLTFNLLPLTILARPLLLSMEPQILEQKDLPVFTVLDGLFGLFAYAVRQEGHGLGEEFGELVRLRSRSEMVAGCINSV
jgi:hypothetical protein